MKSGLMKKSGQEEAGEIDLTPMLDVVFILLIFFIVTSVFVTEAGIEVSKPEASTVEDTSGDLILLLWGGGDIWIDGDQIDPRFIGLDSNLDWQTRLIRLLLSKLTRTQITNRLC